MIEFFDRIKIINKHLQMFEICVIGSYRKFETVVFSLEEFRDFKIELIQQKALDGIRDLDIRGPELPRHYKISKRPKSNNEFGKNHVIQSLKDTYLKIDFEIVDQIIDSIIEKLI